MALYKHTAPFLAEIPQILPLQDRAFTWACSVCFHTLALAVASVAVVGLRNAPPEQAPVARLEILLTDAQQEAEQATAVDSLDQIDPTAPQETVAPTEDSPPIVPAPSPSIVRRTTQRVAAETPPPQTTERPPAPIDQFPVESSEAIEHPSDPSASTNEPEPSTPPTAAEAVEQTEVATANDSPPEPIAHTVTDHVSDHAESSPQEDAAPSPTAMSDDAPADAAASSAAPSEESVARTHPAITQSLSARSEYAWLMELLRRRIIDLQAYPRLARTEGWEGVVVVKTTINSDGNLLDAVVTKSSGFDALDEDAVKLMHRVCPVHLTRDLGKSKIAVMIPIRYRLNGFE